jgi:hypothetical protein
MSAAVIACIVMTANRTSPIADLDVSASARGGSRRRSPDAGAAAFRGGDDDRRRAL